MIDIHHHLLWGMDDGASTLEASVAMAKMAAADGITHIVCSPHSNGQYSYDPPIINAKIIELQERLDRDSIGIKLGRGCDFHMSYENIQEAKVDPTKFSINGLGYLLVEVPDYGLPRGLTEIFYQLQLAGLTPILTHPERNPTLQADQDRIAEWLQRGVLVQVTAGSVLGRMGKHAERMAHELLENRWVHFLATDAHNTTSRAPKMREALELVAAKYGPDYAHLLCVSNPLAVFMGKPMPPQVEPLNLYEDLQEKSWWRRLLGQ
ncbi:CpsB/CapC family capsule biosynthesis tyrosine phosphatase [Tunturiibacter empetritectus]|uniref:protein-tyrosine-phosphatase n=2 Tax=Tunturiibacter TaxID=3154218 RepID=A0A852VE84_9BACT|nr:CpsB/CapC family capsule biosynthesis tyrosine phosphatase [Edaphobacter lichenicola]NYF89990.1 protein-tyrosine phosphatase [Edaphobacter lichenicola]